MMAGPKATIVARMVRDGVSVLDIHGEVTATAENALMDAYTQATSANARVIILNFGGMEYMNSSGIGLLVTLLIRVNRQKQKLLTYGLNEHYQQIFMLTRLNEAIRICGSENDAVANAAQDLS
jgi:anti-sigma B factor antagonist